MTDMEKLRTAMAEIVDDREAFPTTYLTTGESDSEAIWALDETGSGKGLMVYDIYTLGTLEDGREAVMCVGKMVNDREAGTISIEGTDICVEYEEDKANAIAERDNLKAAIEEAQREALSQLSRLTESG